MSATWNKVIKGVAIVAVLAGQVGAVSACPRRKPAGPARSSAPVAVAPTIFAPQTVASPPVAPSPVAATPVSRPAAAEEAAAVPAIDLELYDLRLVSGGNDEQGPSYRVIVKNLGGTDVTSEITVALLASMEKDSDDNVSAIGSLDSLASGATKSVDLRLPKGSEVLTNLTAVAALTEGTDANETDNIANYDRDTILPTAR